MFLFLFFLKNKLQLSFCYFFMVISLFPYYYLDTYFGKDNMYRVPNSDTPKYVLSEFLNCVKYKDRRVNSNLQHPIVDGVADNDW